MKIGDIITNQILSEDRSLGYAGLINEISRIGNNIIIDNNQLCEIYSHRLADTKRFILKVLSQPNSSSDGFDYNIKEVRELVLNILMAEYEEYSKVDTVRKLLFKIRNTQDLRFLNSLEKIIKETFLLEITLTR